MGSVWRAWDLRRSAYVAAKVLGQHDAASLLRFVREQSVRIQHPHVVAPHGWAADDDKVVFAMDLVRGGSVATLLGDHGPLPPAYVAVLLDQLLHGLSAVHAAGVVHRDLKPANLLLDPTGTGRPHLRLSDFGVAGLIDEPRMTRTSTVLGTPGYLAPEQLAGADPDPRQDLYAVGALAHELLTGQRPTPGAPLQSTDGPLGDFIRSCTATDPSQRPANANLAGRLLAETGAVPPSGTAPWADDPDTPEVFDQLPPLPPTWTPTGPAETTSATERPEQHQSSSRTSQPEPRTSQPEPPHADLTERNHPAPAAAPTRSIHASPANPAQPSSVAASAGPAPGTSGAAGGSGGGGRSMGVAGRRRLVWAAVGCFAGAAGLIGSAAWLLVR
jgi:serine/threonine-protein kinase